MGLESEVVVMRLFITNTVCAGDGKLRTICASGELISKVDIGQISDNQEHE